MVERQAYELEIVSAEEWEKAHPPSTEADEKPQGQCDAGRRQWKFSTFAVCDAPSLSVFGASARRSDPPAEAA